MQDADTKRNDATWAAAGLRPHAPALLAGVMLLALALGAAVRDRGGPAPSMRGEAAAPQPARVVRADEAAGVPARAASPRARSQPHGRTATAQASGLREAFETSGDLFAYSQSLAPAVRAGDAEATWLMSKVVDYCAGYSMDPAAFARDTALLGGMGLRSSAAMATARERVGARCQRFAGADRLSPSLAFKLRTDAAGAGSLAAEAALMGMGQPLDSGEDYARDLVDRVRRSLDPDAYAAIAPAMGAGIAGLGTYGQPDVAPQFREIVWQLAACRLGMECGPGSALMTSYCVHGGICSRDRDQGFEEFVYDAAVPRQSADLVREMVDVLVLGTGGGT